MFSLFSYILRYVIMWRQKRSSCGGRPLVVEAPPRHPALLAVWKFQMLMQFSLCNIFESDSLKKCADSFTTIFETPPKTLTLPKNFQHFFCQFFIFCKFFLIYFLPNFFCKIFLANFFLLIFFTKFFYSQFFCQICFS